MAHRKLQTEIDRVLKKVKEGVEIFNEIWDKVYSAQNANQKEKYEADLKKEIKKLQRFRDQIKTWIASSEVKDKKDLLAARKTIEQEMERFKVCEKETKTKAYSKEGLAQAAKGDPNAVAKNEVRQWVTAAMDQLRIQIDGFENELESMQAPPSGKKKGKQNTDNNSERRQHLMVSIDRNKTHEQKLELALRHLENDSVTVDELNDVRDGVEYYVENNQEADFIDDDELYDSLPLDEEPAAPTSVSGAYVDNDDKDDKKDEPVGPTGKQAFTISSMAVNVPAKHAAKQNETKEDKKEDKKAEKEAEKKVEKEKKAEKPAQPAAAQPQIQQPQRNAAQVTAGRGAPLPKEPASAPIPGGLRPGQPAYGQVAASNVKGIGGSVDVLSNIMAKPAGDDKTQGGLVPPGHPASSARGQMAPGAGADFSHSNVSQGQDTSAPGKEHSEGLQKNRGQAPAGIEDTVDDLAGTVGDLALSDRTMSPQALQEEHSRIMSLLETSFGALPSHHDSDRPKQYAPRNPCVVPQSFPTKPSTLFFDNPQIFEQKFDTDTLFFMFYYQQGTYQQYLAARELKKQSWRYHKKYLTWFQRHEEPKVTTDEYEQGTYVYFDYESGWCQRIKADFTFEYTFLEDELNNFST